MSIESKEVKDIYTLYQNINEQDAKERLNARKAEFEKRKERIRNPFGNTTIETEDGKELKQGDPGFKDALAKARQVVRDANNKSLEKDNNSSSSSSSSSSSKETPPAPKLDRESGTPDKRTPPKVKRDEVGSKKEPVVTMGRKSGSERRISQQKIRDERSTTPSIRTGRGQGNRTVVTNPNRQGGEKAKEIIAKKSADAKIDNQVDKYVADRKVPINRDLTIDKSEEGKAKYAEKAAERAAKETEKKVEKVETPKPVKMSNLERQNRARFGDTEIDRLKTKQTDFRKMQSKDMSKDDFIKKYPKSITAQKAAGLRDHYDPSLNEDGSIGKVVGGLAKPKYDGEVLTRSVIMTKDQAKKLNSQISQRNKTKTEDFDAFDIVLGYLQESGQVDSIDEALYIMMEMDAATIQSIVRDFEMLTEEEADRMKDERLEKYGIGHDGSDRKAGSGGRSDSKKPKGKTNLQKETEKKHGKGKSPLDVAKANIVAKYGKGAIAPSKKKKK